MAAANTGQQAPTSNGNGARTLDMSAFMGQVSYYSGIIVLVVLLLEKAYSLICFVTPRENSFRNTL